MDVLIGPHSSNIVSAIILTRLDRKLTQGGYSRLSRHIDDYKWYAQTHEEAEDFVRYLRMLLREYELALNERKLEILPLRRAIGTGLDSRIYAAHGLQKNLKSYALEQFVRSWIWH